MQPLDIENIRKAFTFGALDEMTPEEFEDLGMKDSTTYFKKFVRLTEGISSDAKVMIMALCVAVPKKARIREAISKFTGKSWYKEVNEFVTSKMCNYSSEETEGLIAAVHIPSCCPPLAAACWARFQKTEDLTVDKFLSNRWAAQFHLSSALLERQKNFEKDFWTRVVIKGSSRYEPGFNEGYWLTKSRDQYLLYRPDWSLLKRSDEQLGYVETDIERWLQSFRTRKKAKTTTTASASSISG